MKYKVCECSEFESFGEVIETDSLEDAIRAYKKINPKKLNGIPSVKMNVYLDTINMDVDVEIVRGNNVKTDDFELYKIPFTAEHEAVLRQATVFLNT